MTPPRKVSDADREAGERLAHIRRKRGYGAAADFAASHGIKDVTYRAHERGDGLARHIDEYAVSLKTSAEFLRYGRGPEDVEQSSVGLQNDSGVLTNYPIDTTLDSFHSEKKGTLLDLGPSVKPAPISVPAIGGLPRNLPVMGLAAGGPGDADFRLNGQVADYIRRPPVLEHVKNSFAVYVVGDSMLPRFEEGEPVFVNPARPARIGDYVLCELFPTDEGGEPGPAYIKRLLKKTSEHVELEQFNPAKVLTIDAKLVKVIYKIMLPQDLFV